MKERTKIIQALINEIQAKTYLEIGISKGENFNKIVCETKIGVDPLVKTNYQMSSDSFFEQNRMTFDVIFIDGLHHWEQVYRDVINSLIILNPKGYIVCHDINPQNEHQQNIPVTKLHKLWTGDCWKAWVRLRRESENLNMYVVNTDFGCGVISHGKQNKLIADLELTYENLANNRVEWLNLITEKQFYENINSNAGMF